MEKESIKHWYLQLLLGLVFIAVGIWVYLTPLESYITLTVLFSFAFLIAGVIEITFSIANRKGISNWGWALASGIIDFLVGILLVSHPDISVIVLPFYVGFAIMFRSIMAIGWAIELKSNRGYLLGIGILGLIFSFIMLWNPIFAGMTIVFYTALAFVMIGFFQVSLSLRLRKLSKVIH